MGKFWCVVKLLGLYLIRYFEIRLTDRFIYSSDKVVQKLQWFTPLRSRIAKTILRSRSVPYFFLQTVVLHVSRPSLERRSPLSLPSCPSEKSHILFWEMQEAGGNWVIFCSKNFGWLEKFHVNFDWIIPKSLIFGKFLMSKDTPVHQLLLWDNFIFIYSI